MNDDPTTGGAPREPALSENFAARVIERVRVERRRRANHRRAVLAAALVVAGGIAFVSIRGLGPATPPNQAGAAASWSESDAAETVGGYFFPDAGSIESYGADYQNGQNDAPLSLGTALGFDQGTILPAGVTESDE